MQKGKIAAQCGHASVAAYAKIVNEQPDLLPLWYRQGLVLYTVDFVWK